MKRATGYSTTRSVVGSGSDSIRTLRLDNYLPQTTAHPTSVTVIGNGAFGGANTFGGVIKQYLAAATEANYPASVAFYQDPWLGSGEYTEDYRTERLNAVLQHFTKEQSGQIIGHSWSWPGAVQIAESSPELVGSLVAYEPTGHRGEGAVEITWLDIIWAALKESRQLLKNPGLEGAKAIGALAVSSAGRISIDSALKQAKDSFRPECTTEVLGLRARGLPIGMIIGENDGFFKPPEPVLDSLSAAGVDITQIPTTHLGGVTETRFGRDLFRVSSEVRAPFTD